MSKIHKCKAPNTTTSFNFLPEFDIEETLLVLNCEEYINVCVYTPHRKLNVYSVDTPNSFKCSQIIFRLKTPIFILDNLDQTWQIKVVSVAQICQYPSILMLLLFCALFGYRYIDRGLSNKGFLRYRPNGFDYEILWFTIDSSYSKIKRKFI